MLLSDIPVKIVKPWGAGAGSGYIRPVPVDSQIGIDDGAASYTDGFPPVTFQPTASGGIPPDGRDFNGALNQISAWSRWVAAGGSVFYDPGFVAVAGGYPKYAILASTTAGRLWQTTVDGNTTDPDGGGAAGWISIVPATATAAEIRAGTEATKYVTPAALATSIGDGVGESVILPGGRIMKQGGYGALISAGAQITINFATAFPGICTAAIALPLNASGSGSRDNFIQLISRSATSFTVVVQGTYTGGDQTLNGFDWIAFGY